MTAVLFALTTVVLWVLLWGEITIANVAGGLAVTGVVAILLPDTVLWRNRSPIRPFAVVRLLARIAIDITKANFVVAYQVLSPRETPFTGIIGVPMHGAPDTLLTFVAGVLALSPGILPIDVASDPGTVYAHILRGEDLEATRAQIGRLAELTIRAFGSDELIADLDAGRTAPSRAEITGAP